MQENELRRVLGTELSPSSVIDVKIEEAYRSIRNGEVRRTGRKSQAARRILMGIGSVAAVFALMVTFCVMNPVLASGIPVLGGIFEKLSDWFPFGQLPEEGTVELYQEQTDQGNAGDGVNGTQSAQDMSAYQQTSGDITITLTEVYATNQAAYIGVRVSSAQGFSDRAVYTADKRQNLGVETAEYYSFRQGVINRWRYIEGEFIDVHTFEGIMRIRYSEIDWDDRNYQQALEEAGLTADDIATADMAQYMEAYEIPKTFDMRLDISNVVGELAEPLPVEGAKSGEEQERMTDEEWEAYMKSLPREWYEYPSKYKNWWQEGDWSFELTLTQKDNVSRVIEVNQINEAGIGVRSIELSSVEMTLDMIVSGLTSVVVLDADGDKIDRGSSNEWELAVAGHDISKVYIYICDFYEYRNEIRRYDSPGNDLGRSFQEVLEERALFKTVVETGE